MTSSLPRTDFAELTAGFLLRLNALAPLVQGWMKVSNFGPAPTLLLKLENPEKKILLAPGQVPLVKEVTGPDPEVNLILTLDAEMFHYLLWGKLTFAYALNEKILLLDYARHLPAQARPMAAKPGGPLLFNNLLYEMFLLQVGAGHLLTENTTPDFPLPGERRPAREIMLAPAAKRSLLGPLSAAAAFGLGGFAGVILRLILPWLLKEEDLEAPLVYSTVPSPRPALPPASSGRRLQLMKFLCRRIDLFSVLSRLAQGIMVTGPFPAIERTAG